MQVSERDAAEAARKAERQSAADRIYDKLRLEKEAQLRAQVRARTQAPATRIKACQEAQHTAPALDRQASTCASHLQAADVHGMMQIVAQHSPQVEGLTVCSTGPRLQLGNRDGFIA